MLFNQRLVVSNWPCTGSIEEAKTGRPLTHNNWDDLSMRKAILAVESGKY